MTVPTLAWEQTGTIPQKTTRMAIGGALGRPTAVFAGGVSPTTGGGSHGVVGGGDLLCSGTTLTIAVAAGGAFINGMSSISQGVYYGYNDASVNVVLAAYNAQPRIDLIILQVKDNAEDSSGATSLALTSVTGTASGSPAVPTVPAGALVLAQVAIPATSGATTVTDKRPFAAGLGGVIRCNSATRPTGAALWAGQQIYETDTLSSLWYDGSSWRYTFKPVAAYTPTGLGVANLTSATFDTWYWITNNQVTVTGQITLGASSAIGSGTIQLSLPVTPQTSGVKNGSAQFYDTSASSTYLAQSQLGSGATVMLIFRATDGQNGAVSATVPFTWAAGDGIIYTLTYQAA